jgi:hypothetical protein
MKRSCSRFLLLCLALLPCGFLLADPADAQAGEDPCARNRWESAGGRFALGVGFIYARFDTNAKFSDKQSGLSVYIDAEGTLGLPERDAVPAFYGGFSFSKRHSIALSYFQIRREVTFLDVDYESEGLSIRGSADLQDRTRFYNLSYGNLLFSDERSRVRLLLGVNGLDLRYSFYAEGEIYVEGELDEDGVLDEEVSILAPLPLVGFDFWFAFTPKWSLNPRLKFVGGNYQDVTAAVVSTTLVTRYQFNRRLGMLFGVNYFSADVKIEDDAERIDVSYGYDGAFIGLHVVF